MKINSTVMTLSPQLHNLAEMDQFLEKHKLPNSQKENSLI